MVRQSGSRYLERRGPLFIGAPRVSRFTTRVDGVCSRDAALPSSMLAFGVMLESQARQKSVPEAGTQLSKSLYLQPLLTPRCLRLSISATGFSSAVPLPTTSLVRLLERANVAMTTPRHEPRATFRAFLPLPFAFDCFRSEQLDPRASLSPSAVSLRWLWLHLLLGNPLLVMV